VEFPPSSLRLTSVITFRIIRCYVLSRLCFFCISPHKSTPPKHVSLVPYHPPHHVLNPLCFCVCDPFRFCVEFFFSVGILIPPFFNSYCYFSVIQPPPSGFFLTQPGLDAPSYWGIELPPSDLFRLRPPNQRKL